MSPDGLGKPKHCNQNNKKGTEGKELVEDETTKCTNEKINENGDTNMDNYNTEINKENTNGESRVNTTKDMGHTLL